MELAEAGMPGIGLPPGSPAAMEDVCDLQPLAAHRYTRVANTTIRTVTSPLDRLAPPTEGKPRAGV
jgi:hypothetical protein